MKKLIVCLLLFVITGNTGIAQLKVTIANNGKETIVGVPDKYEIAYFAKDEKEHNYFVVLAPVPLNYLGFRVFSGFGESLEETKVFKTERYKDGGTTIIQSEIGVLFFPSAASSLNAKPSHNFLNTLVLLR